MQSANFRSGYVLACHHIYYEWGMHVRDAHRSRHSGERQYIDAMEYFDPYGIHQRPAERQWTGSHGAMGSHHYYPPCNDRTFRVHKQKR
eukprot:1770724-Karenia_brevis.AAC.1